MVTRRDYTAEEVEAAKRVLIELVHRLGEYCNGVVVVGGWVPYLLLANHEQSAHREHGYRSGRGPQAVAALSGADVEATVVAERGDRRRRHLPVARRRAQRDRLRAVPLHPFPLFAPAFLSTSTTHDGSGRLLQGRVGGVSDPHQSQGVFWLTGGSFAN